METDALSGFHDKAHLVSPKFDDFGGAPDGGEMEEVVVGHVAVTATDNGNEAGEGGGRGHGQGEGKTIVGREEAEGEEVAGHDDASF